MDDAIVERMLLGYAFVDGLLARKVDLFSLSQLRCFLELNAIVLCGLDPQVRAEFGTTSGCNGKALLR